MPLAVVAFAALLALAAECVQYYFVYSTPNFQRMKANLEKLAQKVDDAKDGAAAVNVKKREAKLKEWQQEAGKLNASVQFKSAIIVSGACRPAFRCCACSPAAHAAAPLAPQTALMLVFSFKLVPSVFGSVPMARLPFEPPAFIQKVAQRGLTDADPRDASPVRPARPPPAAAAPFASGPRSPHPLRPPQMFLFMLCQGSIKIIVGKVLGWGPTRKMQEAKLTLPKSWAKQA